MLKPYNNYNTLIHSFEDFILLVFVLIDDLYQQYVPVSVKNRRNIKKAKLSDTECITIAICGELLGIDSEKAWHSFVKRNYHHLFPGMCSICTNLIKILAFVAALFFVFQQKNPQNRLKMHPQSED